MSILGNGEHQRLIDWKDSLPALLYKSCNRPCRPRRKLIQSPTADASESDSSSGLESEDDDKPAKTEWSAAVPSKSILAGELGDTSAIEALKAKIAAEVVSLCNGNSTTHTEFVASACAELLKTRGVDPVSTAVPALVEPV